MSSKDGEPHKLEHVPTIKQRADVKAYSLVGVPQRDIAQVMGIATSTLLKHYRGELDAGRANAHTFIAGKFYELIKKGNTAAVIFACKARLGMKEAYSHQIGGDPDNPTPIATKDVPASKSDMIAELASMGITAPPGFFDK